MILDIPSLIRVKYAGIEYTIQLQSYVVGRDSTLARYFDGHLLQALDVGDSVEKRNEDGKTGLENTVELSHALNNPCCLLGHEAYDGVGGEGGALEVRGRNGTEA